MVLKNFWINKSNFLQFSSPKTPVCMYGFKLMFFFEMYPFMAATVTTNTSWLLIVLWRCLQRNPVDYSLKVVIMVFNAELKTSNREPEIKGGKKSLIRLFFCILSYHGLLYRRADNEVENSPVGRWFAVRIRTAKVGAIVLRSWYW